VRSEVSEIGTKLTPTDEQLSAWAKDIAHEAFISSDYDDIADCPEEGEPFPPYYDDEHNQYLAGMIAELRAARAQLAHIKFWSIYKIPGATVD